ncbi:hypothetical protein [Streptomyces sp. MK5]|uniref:hypothetical protein n=1 Tax=Streptomyces sp. MK5 TaxID=3064253 RepID=UPI002740A51C|nr:hypothetical protein [Streptomyces sp. MK5]
MKRILVFLDARPCSLAAVRHAIPLASEHSLLHVVMVKPRMSRGVSILWSQGVFVPDVQDDVTEATFGDVAALLAPTGLPWDFSEVERRIVRSGPWEADHGAAAPGGAVAVRHKGGPLHMPLDGRRAESLARVWPLGAAAPVVVPCDRRQPDPGPDRRFSVRS